MAWSKCPPQDRPRTDATPLDAETLVAWLNEHFQIDCCRETVRRCLKALGFSWKKAQKLLNKANPAKRGAFLNRLQVLLEELLTNPHHLLLYIDEAHIHLDTDEGYGWSIQGERFWVSSDAPGKTTVSFYGLYLYNFAEVKILPLDCANGDHPLEVFNWLRHTFPTP